MLSRHGTCRYFFMHGRIYGLRFVEIPARVRRVSCLWHRFAVRMSAMVIFVMVRRYLVEDRVNMCTSNLCNIQDRTYCVRALPTGDDDDSFEARQQARGDGASVCRCFVAKTTRWPSSPTVFAMERPMFALTRWTEGVSLGSLLFVTFGRYHALWTGKRQEESETLRVYVTLQKILFLICQKQKRCVGVGSCCAFELCID